MLQLQEKNQNLETFGLRAVNSDRDRALEVAGKDLTTCIKGYKRVSEIYDDPVRVER